MKRVGPFQLGEPIGAGGMARVFAGTHARSGTPVALKVLSSADADHTFEIQAQARLDHPRIVRVFDYGTLSDDFEDAGTGLAPGLPWIAMELVAGGTLHEIRPTVGWPAIRAVLVALLEALAHAHAHDVIHRDLKPRNILRAPSTHAPWGLKLTDFGIAWVPGRVQGDETHGTPAYMAPEQIEMVAADVGAHTDLYALGIIAWRLITGHVPFRSGDGVPIMVKQVARPLPAFAPATEVPDGVEAWLRKLLEKDPARRYQRAAEALRSLPGGYRDRSFPDWRQPRAARPPALADTGLGLIGLRRVPYVGRTAERDALWAALKRARTENSCEAVTILGARGSGRSRLAIGLARQADELGLAHRFLATHAAQPGPFDGLTPMIETALGTRGQDRSGTLARLNRLVQRGQLEKRLVVPLLAMLRRQTGDAPLAEDYLFGVLRDTLAGLAGPRLPVIVLDDVHHSASSQDFADAWIRSGAPGLFLLTATPEAHVDVEAPTIALEALSADEAIWMAQQALPLSPQLAETVRAAAEGHPYFVVELVRGWVERGVVEPGPDGFRLVGSPTLPTGLSTIWLQRLETALRPDGDLRLPMLLAVLGAAADPDEVHAAARQLGLRPSTTRRVLDAMARAGLIWVRKRQLGWSHGLLRETLLGLDGLEEVHLAAAFAVRAIQGEHAPRREARHLEAGGDPIGAADAWRRAAWRSYRRGRFAVGLEHTDHYRRCLDRSGLGPTAAERAEEPVLRWTFLGVLGRRDEARAVIEETAQLLQQLALSEWTSEWNLTDLHLRWALSAENPMLSDQLARDCMKALTETELGSEAWRRLCVMGQDVMIRTGHRHEAADLAARQAEWMEHTDQPELAAYMRVLAASSVAESTSVDEMRRLVETALHRLSRVGLSELAVTVLDQLGEVLRENGQYGEAEQVYRRALVMCQAQGLRSGALPAYNLGVCRLQHRVAGAREAFTESRLRIERAGPPWLTPYVEVADGVARIVDGDPGAWEDVRAIYSTQFAVGTASYDLVVLADLAADHLKGVAAIEARGFATEHRDRLE